VAVTLALKASPTLVDSATEPSAPLLRLRRSDATVARVLSARFNGSMLAKAPPSETYFSESMKPALAEDCAPVCQPPEAVSSHGCARPPAPKLPRLLCSLPIATE